MGGSTLSFLALGAISGIGLAILVFCFQLKPGTPPTDVIYIIIAAVTCAGFCAHQFAGAVVVAMLPLAYSLGIDGWILLGVMPSVYGYFFISNYPSDIATVNFDRSAPR